MAQAKDWKLDKYVIKWLTGLSPKTKKNYLKEYEQWLTFVNKTPTQQISERMHNLTSQDLTERTTFENLWRQFKAYLENKGTLRDASVHSRLRTVASFFSRNDLTLNLHKGDWNSTQKQEVILKFKVDLNDIKNMYGHANLRDKCLLLILSQSGFSEVDIQALRIEEIKDLYDLAINEHYVIEKPREKTNHIQATCLSYEFLHDLRALLEERKNPTEGFIFTSLTTEKGINAIDTRRINECMKALAEKTFSPDKAKQFHTKALRSFYNSALLRAKIQQEVKDLLMGHERQGARSHYSYDSETIKEAYIQAFEFLSINGLQSREDLKQQKAEYTSMIGKQALEIEEQNKKIDALNKNMKIFGEVFQLFKEAHDKEMEASALFNLDNPEIKAMLEAKKAKKTPKSPE
jgi:hypothetical protein